MKKKKIIRAIAVPGVAGLLTGGGIGLYMFNMPKRDVQAAQSDYTLSTSQIVSEYQSFEFEKAMMQQHFNNEHFLESNVHPKWDLKRSLKT